MEVVEERVITDSWHSESTYLQNINQLVYYNCSSKYRQEDIWVSEQAAYIARFGNEMRMLSTMNQQQLLSDQQLQLHQQSQNASGHLNGSNGNGLVEGLCGAGSGETSPLTDQQPSMNEVEHLQQLQQQQLQQQHYHLVNDSTATIEHQSCISDSGVPCNDTEVYKGSGLLTGSNGTVSSSANGGEGIEGVMDSNTMLYDHHEQQQQQIGVYSSPLLEHLEQRKQHHHEQQHHHHHQEQPHYPASHSSFTTVSSEYSEQHQTHFPGQNEGTSQFKIQPQISEHGQVALHHVDGGWDEFLKKWSREIIMKLKVCDELDEIPSEFIANNFLGSPNAMSEDIASKEKELGIASLPKSYKDFLMTSNGFYRTTSSAGRLLAVNEIGWFKDMYPDWLNAYKNSEQTGEQYRVYGEEQRCELFRVKDLESALVISMANEGAVYLLIPNVCINAKAAIAASETSSVVSEHETRHQGTLAPGNRSSWHHQSTSPLHSPSSPVNSSVAMDSSSFSEGNCLSAFPGNNNDCQRGSFSVQQPIAEEGSVNMYNCEWEAWYFANWLPGANRYPSFETMMKSEYDTFVDIEFSDVADKVNVLGSDEHATFPSSGVGSCASGEVENMFGKSPMFTQWRDSSA
eukprot:Nk52_evm91s208 gene=Nk52_evmTU91s208